MATMNRATTPIVLVGVFVSLILVFLAGYFPDDDRKEIDLNDCVSETELYKETVTADTNVLFFGFAVRANPEEDARQLLSLLKYLESATGYKFELCFTQKNEQIVHDLGTGRVHFAAIGACLYLEAHERYGVWRLVHGLNADGLAQYQSVIFVAADSPIKEIDDLRGKRFAFGSFSSAPGHLIPRIILSEHGISLDDLSAYEYTGSHYNCVSSVVSGRFDAGGMQDVMARKLVGEGVIRIICESDFYPSSGIAVNKDVPPAVVAKVWQALIDFESRGCDSAGLYHWDRTEMPNGFAKARHEDYAGLLKWSRKFGLWDEPEKTVKQ